MIEIQSEVRGDQALVAHFRALPERLRDELRKAIFDDLIKLQRYIVTQKLSGQALGRRHGTLAASITPGPILEDANAIVGTLGANTPYARILEYGGTIRHPGGTAYLVDRNGAHFISNRAAERLGNVPRTRPHDIPVPAHPYMRSGLADMRQTILDDLQRAARRAAGGTP
ncbi:HK97 gp10 family phage protein [Burkholderia pseudomallei]